MEASVHIKPADFVVVVAADAVVNVVAVVLSPIFKLHGKGTGHDENTNLQWPSIMYYRSRSLESIP